MIHINKLSKLDKSCTVDLDRHVDFEFNFSLCLLCKGVHMRSWTLMNRSKKRTDATRGRCYKGTKCRGAEEEEEEAESYILEQENDRDESNEAI